MEEDKKNNTAEAVTPEKKAIPSPSEAMSGVSAKPTMRNVIDAMQFQNEKQEEAIARRHKREQIINSISDGVSSIANLYFASKGAPSVQQTSLTDAAQKRYDKLAEERRKKQAEMMSYYINAFQADRQQDNVDRAYNRQVERDKADDDYRNRLHEYQVRKDERDHARQVQRDNVADEQWNKSFEYKSQRDKVEDGFRNRSLSMQGQELSLRQREYNDKNTYYMPVGNSVVAIPTVKLTHATVAGIFSLIPPNKRKEYLKQRRSSNPYGGEMPGATDGYENPSIDDMMYAIGMEAESNPRVLGRIKNLSGEKNKNNRKRFSIKDGKR